MTKIIIPEEEYELTFSRSSSKGGQNVDKVSTKVTLRWNVLNSIILNQEQKERILKKEKNKIDKEGNLIIYSQSERMQSQNKQEVINKLNEIVSKTLEPIKERIPTKPSRASVEKRIKEKKEKSTKKKLRQSIKL